MTMKDNHPETISVTLDGEERILKLGPAAFRLAELKHNISFTNQQMTDGGMATLARLAYVACLVDDPKLKEETFLLKMANSDEGAIIAAVGKSLNRMTEGLSALGASDSEGNGEPGE